VHPPIPRTNLSNNQLKNYGLYEIEQILQ